MGSPSNEKKCWLFALGILLIGAVSIRLLLPLQRTPNSQITEAAYHQIQEGMSKPQVEELLGGPPGNYATGRTLDHIVVVTGGYVDFDSWVGDQGRITVWFGRDGAVRTKDFTPVEHLPEPNLMDKIRSWLRW